MSSKIINSPYHLEILKALIQLKKKGSHLRPLTYTDKNDIHEEKKAVTARSLDRIFSINCMGNFQEDTTLTHLCSWLNNRHCTWEDFIEEHPSPFREITRVRLDHLTKTWREKIQEHIDMELRQFRNYGDYENRNRKITPHSVAKGAENYDLEIKRFASSIYIELTTRKAALPIDEDKDVIVEIYDSWYKLFCIVRDEMKTLPVSFFKDIQGQESIAGVSQKLLNEVLRPHLTEHQAKFRTWFEKAKKTPKNKLLAPQDLQKKYPDYTLLLESLKLTNGKLINTAEIINNFRK